MLRVFLTIDTELWPAVPGWPVNSLPVRPARLEEETRGYIYGRTPQGDFGIGHQMDVLDRHGLKAVFFVESLFAGVAGIESLADTVTSIVRRGHEVGLHPHTEWLGEIDVPGVPRRHRPLLSGCSESEQSAVIAQARANLQAAGAGDIRSFRAGSYSANRTTLRVLADLGISFDSSYNPCYAESVPDLPPPRQRLQPMAMDGVWEFPVSFFSDYPGHFRHAQLCACSFREMRAALEGAHAAGWFAFVIVLHSGELIKRQVGESGGLTVAPDRVNIRRFEQLCQFLGNNRDRFETGTFHGLDPAAVPALAPTQALRSRLWRTAHRFVEQTASRFL